MIVILERLEMSEMSPLIALAYYLESISRPWSRDVELRQSLAVPCG